MAERLHITALYIVCLMPLLLAVTRAGADIALSLTGLLFLLHSFIARDWTWIRKTEYVLPLCLWGYLALNSALQSESREALKMLAWGRFPLFLIALCHWVLKDRASLRKIARFGVPIIALLVIDTYWQYLTGTSLSGKEYPYTNRLGGPMSHPNIGNLLLKSGLPILAMGWWVALTGNHSRNRIAGLALLTLAWMALLPMTGERATTLLMLLALFFALCLFAWIRPQQRKKAILAGVGLVCACLLIILSQKIVFERTAWLIEQLQDIGNTSYGNLYIAAFRLWTENPLFGIGAANFFEASQSSAERFGLHFYDVHPHNIYLHWLVETGIVGIGLFVASMALLVKNLYRNLSFDGFGIVPCAFAAAATLVVLWPIIVTQSVFSNWPAILFWYALALAICTPRIAKQP